MLMWGLFLFLCEQKGDWSPVLHTILFMWCIGYANDYRAHLREFPQLPPCVARKCLMPARCRTPRTAARAGVRALRACLVVWLSR